jgi:hypothetical protein
MSVCSVSKSFTLLVMSTICVFVFLSSLPLTEYVHTVLHTAEMLQYSFVSNLTPTAEHTPTDAFLFFDNTTHSI